MIALQASPALERDPLAKPLQVALAGNPNAGKTSIFNALTGAHQHVGNYPGVTVEKRTGKVTVGGKDAALLDLPGTYSLSSYSPEERIAERELLGGDLDVVVVVADSTSLKRSLVLLSHVMQIGVRVVLCLNMADEAKLAGQQLDLDQMRALLGVPVVETVGHRGAGMDDLREAIAEAAAAEPAGSRLVLGERLDRAVAAVSEHLGDGPFPAGSHPWIATRLLVGDEAIAEQLDNHSEQAAQALAEADRQRELIEAETGRDIRLFVTERSFGFIDGMLREVTRRAASANARAASDRVDSVLVHRVLGLPIFAVAMYGVFWLTFTAGEVPMGWLERGFGALALWVDGLWPAGSESVLRSLLVDGVIGGVGGVIVFLPNILLLFFGLALLEDTGYMARAAFLMDRVMHRFGLHGKSFLPMVTGFGCTIPGIMATRTLENERDRLTTMLVLPLMSCGARLPIYLLLVPAFFPLSWRAPMLWLIYAIGIVLAFLLALLLRRSLLKGDDAPFVMELPPYRLPTLRGLATKMAERGWLYVRKAGTIILALAIVMWAATAFPKVDRHQVDADAAAGRVVIVAVQAPADAEPAAQAELEAAAIAAARATAPPGTEVIGAREADGRRAAEALRHSVAGRVGATMEPVIRPLGFDWKIGVGIIGALAAKEVFVAQMGIVYSLGEMDDASPELRTQLGQDYSPLTGFALILFLLIAAPCMATVALTRRESGSWKWAALQFGGLTAVAYLAALVVFQVGSLLGLA
ncbi:MAG: ferrous iron transport protein B [Deltaproteobacteria bacterium]|nr:ferrous iron transport protein B [Deltaproteobacteria bacterium]